MKRRNFFSSLIAGIASLPVLAKVRPDAVVVPKMPDVNPLVAVEALTTHATNTTKNMAWSGTEIRKWWTAFPPDEM